MSTLTSQAALASLQQAEFTAMATRIQKAGVSPLLAQVFGAIPPESDGETPMPDWDLLQESHANLLDHATAEVRRTDKVHRLNLVAVAQLRQRRRDLVAGINRTHRDLRKSFAGTYGEKALALVGLDAPPVRRFLSVREQALEVSQRMKDPTLVSQLPPPRAGLAPLAPMQLAAAMEATVQSLEEVMEALERQGKLLDESLVVKRAALVHHHRVYLNVARLQEAYCRLAGLDALADRMRAPNPGRRHGDPPGETDEPTGSPEPAG